MALGPNMVETMFHQVEMLKKELAEQAKQFKEQQQRAQGVEEFVAGLEDQSAIEAWRTKGGGKGSSTRREAASPYGKGVGSKDEAEKATG